VTHDRRCAQRDELIEPASNSPVQHSDRNELELGFHGHRDPPLRIPGSGGITVMTEGSTPPAAPLPDQAHRRDVRCRGNSQPHALAAANVFSPLSDMTELGDVKHTNSKTAAAPFENGVAAIPRMKAMRFITMSTRRGRE
jgi:hypothetical protein